MKSIYQPLLARLRAQPGLVSQLGTTDIKGVIERSLRDAGLMPSASPISPAVIDTAVIDGEYQQIDDQDERGTRTGAVSRQSGFSAGRFGQGSDARAYKLFVPSGFADQRLPLIVLLHGCTQDPDDFARGTRMNLLAQETGALVLYPAQAVRSNNSRCWNWFQPGDQRRGAGEPALLAAITRQIMDQHAVDPRRVHVAGLSAGGAMAAILGREYPDLYASIGVHSGLPPGAAHDLPSAFAAMKKAPAIAQHRSATPMIVFHGDQDRTVDPQNGENLLGTDGVRTRTAGRSGRAYTRSLIKDAEGRVQAEHWLVHGAGHAWSGGSSEGSYTDPSGPDASREMLRFFSEHPQPVL